MKTCPLCGKNDLKHQGALNIHMYHCKMKQVNVTRETLKQGSDDCTHDFRLLNLNSPIEKKAYNSGYHFVCTKCQDLKGE